MLVCRYREIVLSSVAALNAVTTKLKELSNTVSCFQVLASLWLCWLAPLRQPPARTLCAVPCTQACPTTSPAAAAAATAARPGPSLLPLVTLSVAQIGELTSSHPDLPEHQLPWLLNIMLETTRHCL